MSYKNAFQIKLLKRILALLLLFSILLASSCGQKKTYQKTSLSYFDTVITVTAYAENQAAFDGLAEEIFAELERYHKLYDIYHEYNGIINLCTLNQIAWISPVTVDSDMMSLLLFGKEIYTKTNGATNIAMGSVLSLWHKARATKILPDDALLRTAAEHMDINHLILNTEENTVFFADPLLRLDVGAIAKGYAAERIAQDLEEKGFSGILLNVGGNLVAVGKNTPWQVAVQDPDKNAASPYLKTLSLTEGALVTSGSYQRYFTVGDVRYHHIIHPQTLYPENEYLLISVLCPDSGLADALSTALFNLPLKDGLALIETMNDTEALWYTSDGNCFTSSGFPLS